MTARTKSETKRKVGAFVAHYAAEAIRQRRRAQGGHAAEAVHRLRVATRRLQETLEFFGPFMPERPLRRLERRVRRIRRALGARRNLQVMAELLRELDGRLDPEARESARRLRRGLKSEAAGVGRIPALERRARLLLRDVADREVAFEPRGVEVLSVRLRAAAAALRAARRDDHESLHRFRIALKRYRYTLEILERAGVRGLKDLIGRARALQGALGRLHDLDVLIETVRSRSAPPDRRALAPALARERLRRYGAGRRALRRFDPQAQRRRIEACLKGGATP